MSVTPLDAKTAQMRMQQGDMQDRARQIGNLAGPGGRAPVDKEKKLREACEGFESIFIQKMWEEMRKTLPKSTLLHGKEEQFWQGMYDQELAKKMTSAGGIGLADMMYAQLSRGLVSASRATATDASGMGQRAFTPEAAPMLTRANTAEGESEGNGSGAAGSDLIGPACGPDHRYLVIVTPAGKVPLFNVSTDTIRCTLGHLCHSGRFAPFADLLSEGIYDSVSSSAFPRTLPVAAGVACHGMAVPGRGRRCHSQRGTAAGERGDPQG